MQTMRDSMTTLNDNEYTQYRALSVSAIVTFILGVLSLAALLFTPLLVLSAIGMIVGLFAVLTCTKRRDELSGERFAKIGLTLSVFTLVVGSLWAAYVYVTEVPEGYQRISFFQLQPDERSRLPIPPEAVELNGKKVFVKGYIHPGLPTKKNIKTFVLVPDMGTCCFGGQPKLTDMIEVELEGDLRTDYNMVRRKLAGTLTVSPQKKPVSGLDGVYYRLSADYVR